MRRTRDGGTSVTLMPETDECLDDIESALKDVESRLTGLIAKGAHAGRQIDEIVGGLTRLQAEILPFNARVVETLDRRDLSFDTQSRLEHMHRRALWLFRKCRLEQIFFRKLHVERSLRDGLYRQVIEAMQELSALDDEERKWKGQSDDALSLELIALAADPETPNA